MRFKQRYAGIRAPLNHLSRADTAQATPSNPSMTLTNGLASSLLVAANIVVRAAG